MNKLLTSLSLGIIALTIAAPAQAQQHGGSYVIDATRLDRVKPYNAPRQVDVIDNRPIIHNHLTPDQAPDTLDINASIPPSQPGRHVQVQIGDPSGGGAQPYRTGNPNLNSTADLAPAADMFNSNVPARPLTANRNLPNGQNTGIHSLNLGPQSAPQTSQRLSGHLQPLPSRPVIAKDYNVNYKETGSSSGGQSARSSVTGTYKFSPLAKRLLQPSN